MGSQESREAYQRNPNTRSGMTGVSGDVLPVLEKTIRDKAAKIQRLDVRIDQLTKEMAVKSNGLPVLEKTIIDKGAKIQNLDERIDHLTKELVVKSNRLNVLEKTIIEKTAKIQTFDVRIDQLTKDTVAKSNKLIALEHSEELARRNARRRIDELELCERELKSKIDRLSEEYKNLEIKLMRLKTQESIDQNDSEPPTDHLVDCTNKWEREFVVEKFRNSLTGEPFKVSGIKKVNNLRLSAQFEAKKKRLQDKSDTVRELLLWRSVARSNVSKVAADNFPFHGDFFFVRSIRNCDKYFRSGQSKQIYLVKVATAGESSEECPKSDFFKRIRLTEDDAYLPMYFVTYEELLFGPP